MIPPYKPNVSLVAKKVGKIVNNLYWLISNSGSLTQYPKLELGRDATVVYRNVIKLLTMDEKDYVAYLAVMYKLNEEENVVIHFKVDIERVDVSELHTLLNSVIVSLLNSTSLVHEYGVTLNKDNFVKYVGLVGYVDQYEVDSVELSLFKMMIPDEDIPPSTYEGIRLLEVEDFLGEFLKRTKRPYS